MLGEGLQVPVGGRRCLREAIVNLVGYPTVLLLLDRGNPPDHAAQLALAFGKVLVEAAQLLLGPLALCDVARDADNAYGVSPIVAIDALRREVRPQLAGHRQHLFVAAGFPRGHHSTVYLRKLTGGFGWEQLGIVLADDLLPWHPKKLGTRGVDHQVATPKILHKDSVGRLLDNGREDA